MNMAVKPRETQFPVDLVTFGCALLIITIGLVMVASASIEISAERYDNPYYLLTRHILYLAISIGVALLATGTPIRVWQKLGVWLILLGIGLLVLVLIPGIGHKVNESVRWIKLGSFTLQGSEFLKLFVVLYIAGYLVRDKGEHKVHFRFLEPLSVLVLLVGLLMYQPDFGTAVVITAVVLGIIFLAGTPLVFYLVLVGGFVCAVFFLVGQEDYRVARLESFVDPWADPYGTGYQLTQGLIAFGRGDLFGVGLGNSIQKLFFLPEAHTDFLFSILAEELGVIGATLVISLFCVISLRALWIGKKAFEQGHKFHAYVAYGASLMIGIQACINLGGNLGLLPTKGITLPLMSYGGNSLIVSCLFIGILLRIEYESRTPPDRRRSHGR